MRLCLLLFVLLVSEAAACPFCAPPPPSLCQELEEASAVVVARRLGGGKFQVEKVLKGPVEPGRTVLAGSASNERVLLVTTTPPANPFWMGRPRTADPQLVAFVGKVLSLGEDTPGRLAFFVDYLDSPVPELAESAYSEFAVASHDQVVKAAGKLGRETIRRRLYEPGLDEGMRSLYLVMLGSHGAAADVPFLEKLVNQARGEERPEALGALLACYLSLKGPAGLPTVEQGFLTSQTPFSKRRAAIEAVRFHGERPGKPIPRARAAAALRLVLDDPEVAGLVLRDLALWEDWKALPEVCKLADMVKAEHTWVLIPIVRYLKSCPLPEARQQLQKLDPGFVSREIPFKR